MKRLIPVLFALLPWAVHAAVYSVPGADVQTFVGASSDTKPLLGISSGAVFIETDTSIVYWWQGDKVSGSWVQKKPPSCESNALADSEGLCFTALGPWDWEVVAASDTDEPCGTTGGAGDYLHELILLPAVAAAGAVSIEDGTGTNYTIHPGGGTTALTQLHPIVVPMGLVSALGAWEITTGTNMSVICKGRFDVQ